MGNFYLRMPKSKTKPESWRLISSQLHGPYADGQLKLGTDNGWAAHCDRLAPDAELFQFRNRGNKEWLPACYMSVAKNFETLEFKTIPITNIAGYRPDTGEVVNYNVPLGWQVTRDTLYEIWDFNFIDGHAVFYENPQREADVATAYGLHGASVPFYRDQPGPSGGFGATNISSMGWIGNEDGTVSRERYEVQSWFSLPIGAVLEQAEVMRTVAKINGAAWAQSAQLFRAEIDFIMNGWSVDKSQKPWMNSYLTPGTTNALYGGVGSLRQIGQTPVNSTDPLDPLAQSNLVTFKLDGVIPPATLPTVGAGIYSAPAARDYPYGRMDGELVWAGGLNDLGHAPLGGGFGSSPPHGLPYKAPVIATQILNVVGYDVRDAITYQIQMSDLPDPDPISFFYYRTLENTMNVTAKMRVIYAF